MTTYMFDIQFTVQVDTELDPTHAEDLEVLMQEEVVGKLAPAFAEKGVEALMDMALRIQVRGVSPAPAGTVTH